MAEYYLIAQLPSLDGSNESTPIPITEERFLELCNDFLGRRTLRILKQLTLVPSRAPEKTGSLLVDTWNDGERKLRLALGRIRADKMKKPFEGTGTDLLCPPRMMAVASAAAKMESPMAAEKILFDYRLEFLETLRPMDAFSEEYLFYYGLKLKLLLHIKQFDVKRGETAYRNLYNAILNGDRLEVVS